MTSLTSYSYSEREVFDLKSLLNAVRLIVINIILAIIFIFLTMEEIDWNIYSTRNEISDEVIDKTSWNLKTFFKFG